MGSNEGEHPHWPGLMLAGACGFCSSNRLYGSTSPGSSVSVSKSLAAHEASTSSREIQAHRQQN